MDRRTTSLLTPSGATGIREWLSIPGGEVAGAELVRELPAEVALPAWQTLRSVLAWAAAEPGRRGEQFDPQAMEAWEIELLRAEWEPDLRLPLAVLVGLLVDAEGASPERMARACICVTDWALEHGAVSTALGFAEAAALAWPEQPRYAYMCGRLLRTHGRGKDAEQWMRRCVRAAEGMDDYETQALGLNSLGNVFYERGSYPEAVRMHRRALQQVRKHRIEGREGEILHDLFVCSWYAGDTLRAEEYAWEAFEHYKSGHHRLPTLAHDVAFSWVVKGYYTEALFVLQGLPRYFSDPGERVRVLASIARAAGGCGHEESFEAAAGEVRAILEASPSLHGTAAALIEVAIGATTLSRWRTAELAVEQAVRIATSRAETDVLARADSTLLQIHARRAARIPRHENVPKAMNRLDALANGFVTSLESGDPAWI